MGTVFSMCQSQLVDVLEQVAFFSPKTEDGGLFLPLKSMDWVLLAFWDRVEYPLDDGF